MRWSIVAFSLLACAAPAAADEGPRGRHGAPAFASPYAGQESRPIKSLSEPSGHDPELWRKHNGC